MSETKKTLTTDYFEKVYEANDDPWNFQTSEYEAEKYAATLAALPREKYENVFEIGCSIGVLTEKLAKKCGKLLSVDVSEKALAQAKQRCRNLKNVHFQKMQIPKDFPDEIFDLILVSEVGYYLSQTDWEKAMSKIFAQLSEKGEVVLIHWTPFVDDYPQTGDEVHNSFADFARNKMRKLNERDAEKYRLDIWEKL